MCDLIGTKSCLSKMSAFDNSSYNNQKDEECDCQYTS